MKHARWGLGAIALTVAVGCGGDDADDAAATSSVEATAVDPAETSATTASGDDASASTETPADTEPLPDSTGPGTAPASEAVATTTGEPGGGPDGGSTGGADTCALLEGVDLDALLGEPAAAPESASSDIGDWCTIDPVSGESRGAARLTITDSRAAENFETQQEVLGVDSTVEGIGDGAVHTGPYILVLDGDVFFLVQVVRDAAIGFNVPDEELEHAARQVLENLRG